MPARKQCPCCQRGFRDPVPTKPGSRGLAFHRLLSKAADEAGLTNTEIARRLKVTQSSVTQTLKRENLSERVFRDYAAAMGFEVKLAKKSKRKR